MFLNRNFFFPACRQAEVSAPIEKRVEDLLEELPRWVLVGVGQRRTRRSLAHSEVAQLPLTAAQAGGDLSQAVSAAELTEQHRDKLRPAIESPRVPLGAGLFDQLLKFGSRK